MLDIKPLAEGSTAVHRDVYAGRVWAALAARVIRDDPDGAALAVWPGCESLTTQAYLDYLHTGDESSRLRMLDDLAAGVWQLGPRTWDTRSLLWFPQPQDHYSVDLLFDATGRPEFWYVNFELPCRRTEFGYDTCDLALDLVAQPDLSAWHWKDEDEYAHARRLGIVTDEQHRAVMSAGEKAIALIEAAAGPFDQRWLDWSADPAWPIPRLPADTLTLPCS